MHEKLNLHLASEKDTEALGATIARTLRPGLAIFLEGDLGAGKTALARSIIRALGHEGKVKSPTYTLVELYTISGLNLYHFDLYRFEDPDEWNESGFREYFNPESIVMVEWPEKGGAFLPTPDIRIVLGVEGEGRRAEIEATSETGSRCLTALKSGSLSC
ncbi:MAG: tRNA (adenosine(37)-N6)-threonylcarbamoyltransferase complex ATPase subunit type 1 TsaE [Burkholderiales bacterium]|nr:tRNA (adenosine(37)-N6)-threonylcarbamoyltransferase complex ATPase subunit type 1 TsaE [Burkholderiales bacterium]